MVGHDDAALWRGACSFPWCIAVVGGYPRTRNDAGAVLPRPCSDIATLPKTRCADHHTGGFLARPPRPSAASRWRWAASAPADSAACWWTAIATLPKTRCADHHTGGFLARPPRPSAASRWRWAGHGRGHRDRRQCRRAAATGASAGIAAGCMPAKPDSPANPVTAPKLDGHGRGHRDRRQCRRAAATGASAGIAAGCMPAKPRLVQALASPSSGANNADFVPCRASARCSVFADSRAAAMAPVMSWAAAWSRPWPARARVRTTRTSFRAELQRAAVFLQTHLWENVRDQQCRA